MLSSYLQSLLAICVVTVALIGCNRWEPNVVGLERYVAINSNIEVTARSKFVVFGDTDGQARVLDLETFQTLYVLTDDITNVQAVAVSPDGSRIALGKFDSTISLWKHFEGTWAKTQLEGHFYLVAALAFSSDGTKLASGGRDNWTFVWDASTGQPLWKHERRSKGSIEAVNIDPSGALVSSGSSDNSLLLLSAKDGSVIRALAGHTGKVTRIRFFGDGAKLASTSYDGTVRTWETATGRSLQTWKAHRLLIRSLAVSADDTVIATGSADQKLKLWSAETGEPLGEVVDFGGEVASIAFAEGGASLVAATEECLWYPINVQAIRTSSVKTAQEFQRHCPAPLVRQE